MIRNQQGGGSSLAQDQYRWNNKWKLSIFSTAEAIFCIKPHSVSMDFPWGAWSIWHNLLAKAFVANCSCRLLYSTLRFPWLVETIPSKSQKPKKEFLVEKQANYLFPAFLLEKPSAFNIFDPHGCLEKGGWLQE